MVGYQPNALAHHKSAHPSCKYNSEDKQCGTQAVFCVLVGEKEKHGGLSNQCWINLSSKRYLQPQFKLPALLLCALNHKYRDCFAYLRSSIERCFC